MWALLSLVTYSFTSAFTAPYPPSSPSLFHYHHFSWDNRHSAVFSLLSMGALKWAWARNLLLELNYQAWIWTLAVIHTPTTGHYLSVSNCVSSNYAKRVQCKLSCIYRDTHFFLVSKCLHAHYALTAQVTRDAITHTSSPPAEQRAQGKGPISILLWPGRQGPTLL